MSNQVSLQIKRGGTEPPYIETDDTTPNSSKSYYTKDGSTYTLFEGSEFAQGTTYYENVLKKYELGFNTSTDTLYINNNGTIEVPFARVSAISTDLINGTLPVSKGGTGQTSVANIQAGKDGNGNTISSTYLKLSGGTMTGNIVFENNNIGIQRVGRSVGWNKGRDSAIIKTTSLNGYGALASIKTNNGSWDIGAYNNTSFTDDLLFTYVTDTQYNGTSAVSTAQIKILENGHIVGTLDGNATNVTGIVSVANGGTGATSLTASRLLYSSSTTKVDSTSITTNGSYLGNISNLTINAAHQTAYRFYVNGPGRVANDSYFITGSSYYNKTTNPSENHYGAGFYIVDSNDEYRSYARGMALTNGQQGLQLETKRVINNTNYYSTLNLLIDANGNKQAALNSRLLANDGINANGYLIIKERAHYAGITLRPTTYTGTISEGSYGPAGIFANFGSDSVISNARLCFREYSPNSTANTATTTHYEEYLLPSPTVGRAGDGVFHIWTSKTLRTGTCTANGSGSTDVPFGYTYASTPIVIATLSTTGDNVAGDFGTIKIWGKTTTGFKITLGGVSSSTNRNVDWVAVGY